MLLSVVDTISVETTQNIQICHSSSGVQKIDMPRTDIDFRTYRLKEVMLHGHVIR